MPPKLFVKVIAILLLGIPGLLFLGAIEASERLRRAFRRKAATNVSVDEPEQGDLTGSRMPGTGV